jgi:hypothetical protein
LRDPYQVQGIPDWFSTDPDRNTRLFLFAQNLELNPGQAPLSVIVRFIGSNNQVFDVPAIDVRTVLESLDPFTERDSEITQVKVRLPDNLPVGTCTVIIRANGQSSNMGTIRIVP